MIDELRALAVFARVAELGSFRAAARALSLSPSVISHHVSELERRVGVPLLYRSTRHIALTPDGERLLPSARELVEAAERGLDALSGQEGRLRGTLRLTVPAFLAGTTFSDGLAAFSAAHPGVRLAVSFTDAPRDLLREGFDVALRIGRLATSTHRTRRLAEMRRLLVAAPGYAALRPPPATPEELESWDYVQLSTRPAEVALQPPGGGEAVVVGFAPRLSADSAAAMRALVLAGAGLTALPEVVVREDIACGRLVEILPGWQIEGLGVWAVWPDSAQRPGLTLRFVEHMAPRVAALFGEASADVEGGSGR